MDYLEQKFSVFNKAIEMQAASFEELLDIKEKEIVRMVEEVRSQMETALKRKTRGNVDAMQEIQKT